MTYNVKIGLLRQIGRDRFHETGDFGAAAFAMVKEARAIGATEAEIRQAVNDLHNEGIFPASGT